LKRVIEIYSRNKLKAKINNKLPEGNTINRAVIKVALYHQQYLTCRLHERNCSKMESYLYKINTLVYAEGPALIAGSGDNLRKGIFTLQNMAE
jgi:hypothetical protein